MKILIIITLLISLGLNARAQISDRYCRIAFKQVEKFHEVTVEFPEINTDISGLRHFEVKQKGIQKGHLLVSKAPAKFSTFIFFVYFEPNMENIKLLNILHYTETHGLKVKSRRWLSKFQGMNASKLSYGNTVDAVSGSTISAISIIEKIAEISGLIKNERTVSKKQ